jgi:hypothetical protein
VADGIRDKSINSVGLKAFNTARPHFGAVDYTAGSLGAGKRAGCGRAGPSLAMKSFQAEAAVMHTDGENVESFPHPAGPRLVEEAPSAQAYMLGRDPDRQAGDAISLTETARRG